MRRMITTKQIEALSGGGHKIVIDYVDDGYNFKVIHTNGEEEDIHVDSEMPTPIILTNVAAVIAGADAGEKTIYLSLDSGCGISQYEGT